MEAEKLTRSSFFDDDDMSVVFDFQKPEKKHQKDLNQPAIVADVLKKKTPTSSAIEEALYSIHNKTLAYFKTPSSKTPDAVIDLSFSKLKVLLPTEDNSDFGFSLTKNDSTFIFYSSEKQVIEDWVEVLKDMCILSTFHDDYKALKMIGRGSFAKVYLVESKATGKMYAVKAFTKEGIIFSNKTNGKPSMLNEIDIMRSLDHENVIKLFEVHETENSIYLVLEIVQGKSLQDALKKSTFKDEYSDVKVLNMIRSILDALAYFDSKNIMHRDLKPDNILLDKDSKIKIADFGLATIVDLPEYIFKKCGTPGYIAPEVFKYDSKNHSSSHYDSRVDVFSAGCIFYYMLFKTPLFEGAGASEILEFNRKFCFDNDSMFAVRKELNDPESKIPKDALDLLLKLLEPDPKKRISASEALTHPYFIPVPQGMLKVSGSNDLVSGNSPKLAGRDKIIMRPNQLPVDHILQRSDTPKTPSLFAGKDRFTNKNSFYLDVGKPEFNGKTDTLTGGSNTNSVLLNKRDSNASVGSGTSSDSPAISNRGSLFQKSSSLKPNSPMPYNPMGSTGQSFLKAAIFRNMQKNQTVAPNNEEAKEAILKLERRRSDNPSGRHHTFSPTISSPRSPDSCREASEESSSNYLEPIKSPGKTPRSSRRRFQPFAQKIIIKANK